jgi:hypothetical protein
VASLLDKYGEYIQGENDNNTALIKEALATHTQVRQNTLTSLPCLMTVNLTLPLQRGNYCRQPRHGVASDYV